MEPLKAPELSKLNLKIIECYVINKCGVIDLYTKIACDLVIIKTVVNITVGQVEHDETF